MGESAEVVVEQGWLKGTLRTPKGGAPRYYAFVGVPYAKPPLKSLRFRAPQPPEQWEGVRAPLAECPSALQQDFGVKVVSGSEDCLYLNVYTPKVPSQPAPQRPVMVWIMPGGFTYGKVDKYQPQYLCARGVVVVVISHRLGTLGFLSLNSKLLPGNAALKDCVAALRWVKQNIAVFGGDPNLVTVFGSSAGAGIIDLLQLSPAARGLFHRAISQGGSALTEWCSLDPATARAKAFRLGELLGCSTQDERELLEFLQRAPARQIFDHTDALIDPLTERAGISLAFFPVSEAGTEGSDEEMFLPDTPRNLIYSNRFYPVPWLAGFCEWEGFNSVIPAMTQTQSYCCLGNALEKADKDLERFVPLDLRLPKGSPESKDVAKRIRDVYFKGGRVNRLGYFNLCTDLLVSQALHESARYHAAHPQSRPVFIYVFTLKSPTSYAAQIPGQPYPGATHGDDLAYIFESTPPKLFPSGSIEALTRDRFTKMWTNFAKFGKPVPEGDPELKGVTWRPIPASRDGPVNYLNIGKNLTPGSDLLPERMAMWTEVYKRYCNVQPST